MPLSRATQKEPIFDKISQFFITKYEHTICKIHVHFLHITDNYQDVIFAYDMSQTKTEECGT